MQKTSVEAYDYDNDACEQLASGVHYWNVHDDLVYSDASAAELFGFSENDGLSGLPIESYLARIHPEDLPRVAKSIHDAMIRGRPYHEDYRTLLPGEGWVEIVAIGRWFHDPNGDPSHYAGILFRKAPASAKLPSVHQLCLIAYDMARAEGRMEAAEKIIEAIGCLANAEAPPHVLRECCH